MKVIKAVAVASCLFALIVWLAIWSLPNPTTTPAVPTVSDPPETSPPVVPTVSVPPKASPKEDAIRQLKLNTSLYKGGFGNVLIADFAFKNHSDRDVKDIEITCEVYGPSGTQIGQVAETVFVLVKAKGGASVEDFSMGFINSQATRTSCEITNLVLP